MYIQLSLQQYSKVNLSIDIRKTDLETINYYKKQNSYHLKTVDLHPS